MQKSRGDCAVWASPRFLEGWFMFGERVRSLWGWSCCWCCVGVFCCTRCGYRWRCLGVLGLW